MKLYKQPLALKRCAVGAILTVKQKWHFAVNGHYNEVMT